MRVDAREIYLKRLLLLDRTYHSSFRHWLNLSLLILQEGEEVKGLELEAIDAVKTFLLHFRTEKGTPALEDVLYTMDKMRYYGRGILKIKTRQTFKKYTYQELLKLLGGLENNVMSLVRKKTLQIRITNPDIVL